MRSSRCCIASPKLRRPSKARCRQRRRAPQLALTQLDGLRLGPEPPLVHRRVTQRAGVRCISVGPPCHREKTTNRRTCCGAAQADEVATYYGTLGVVRVASSMCHVGLPIGLACALARAQMLPLVELRVCGVRGGRRPSPSRLGLAAASDPRWTSWATSPPDKAAASVARTQRRMWAAHLCPARCVRYRRSWDLADSSVSAPRRERQDLARVRRCVMPRLVLAGIGSRGAGGPWREQTRLVWPSTPTRTGNMVRGDEHEGLDRVGCVLPQCLAPLRRR